MTNVVVLSYCPDDTERLRQFVNDESNGAHIASKYSRAEWNGFAKRIAKRKPDVAYIVRVKDKKKEFELRMKFDTMPRLGVEF